MATTAATSVAASARRGTRPVLAAELVEDPWPAPSGRAAVARADRCRLVSTSRGGPPSSRRPSIFGTTCQASSAAAALPSAQHAGADDRRGRLPRPADRVAAAGRRRCSPRGGTCATNCTIARRVGRVGLEGLRSSRRGRPGPRRGQRLTIAGRQVGAAAGPAAAGRPCGRGGSCRRAAEESPSSRAAATASAATSASAPMRSPDESRHAARV